ncbi:MAG: internal scaffolding protein [Microvirus sp.]|nr:MAG: internal scaffolding protein [Microvirus sp.]
MKNSININTNTPTNTNTNTNTNSHPQFISAYGPKLKIQLHFPAHEGRTKQDFASECDINVIMARYKKTGLLDFVNKNAPRYGDITGVDFQEAHALITTGKTMFAELPSNIRDRFENDPAQFLEFTSNSDNLQEMASLGLLSPQGAAKASALMAEAQLDQKPATGVPSANPSSTPKSA